MTVGSSTLNVRPSISGAQTESVCPDARTEKVEPFLSDSHGNIQYHLHLASHSDSVFITLPRGQRHTILELSRRVIYPDSGTLLWTEGNETYSDELSENCLYQGRVNGHVGSSAAVSLCDGLVGYRLKRKK